MLETNRRLERYDVHLSIPQNPPVANFRLPKLHDFHLSACQPHHLRIDDRRFEGFMLFI